MVMVNGRFLAHYSHTLTNLLVDIPMIDSVCKVVEESLMEVVDFWNLVDVLNKAGIGKTSCLRLFQRLQVNL